MARAKIVLSVIAALFLINADRGWARGPGGGGPPGLAGGTHSGPGFSGSTPSGWNSPGLRTGWVNGQPPGFTQGKKKGWHRGTLFGTAPPGWQR